MEQKWEQEPSLTILDSNLDCSNSLNSIIIFRIKHAKEQYHAVIRDHIENSETTVLVDVDSGDDGDYDSPIDIICCEQSSEEWLEETTAPGTCAIL